MIGVLLAIGSAFAFSLSDVLVRRGVRTGSASQGAFVTVMLGVPLFLIASVVAGQIFRLGSLSLASVGYLSAAGIVHYVFGRYFNYRAIGAIGASRSSPVQALSLPYSALTALIFLDEGITAGMIFGIVLILLGPFIMVERRARVPVTVSGPQSPRQESDAQGLRQVEGYVFATASALSYGTSPVLIRAALEGESGVALLGGFVSYVAAAGVLLLSLSLPGRRSLIRALEPKTLRIFFGAGFAVFMAQMLRFLALSLASVAVATALLRLGSIFTLCLSWLVNRHIEVINWRVVVGILVSVLGAVILVLAQA
jgi:drug/metabolite transporter (DMT)-like permease